MEPSSAMEAATCQITTLPSTSQQVLFLPAMLVPGGPWLRYTALRNPVIQRAGAWGSASMIVSYDNACAATAFAPLTLSCTWVPCDACCLLRATLQLSHEQRVRRLLHPADMSMVPPWPSREWGV